MTCPICSKEMDSTICVCGYDKSRDYEKYPTLSPVPTGTASVSHLVLQHNALIRCSGCGHSGFSLNHMEGAFRCLQCGRVLTREELAPLLRALNLQDSAPVDTAVQPEAPSSIDAIAVGGYHTVVLYADGTCRAIGDDFYGQCRVDGWQNVRLIAANENSTVGLTHDNRVLLAGKAEKNPELCAFRQDAAYWYLSDVTQIALGDELVLLYKNGTVKSTQQNLQQNPKWTRVDAIAAGKNHIAALHRDGSISIESSNGSLNKNHVQSWQRLAAITSGYWHISALIWGGTVQSTNFSGDTSGWTNITAITAGADYTAGLREDGTVVATGNNAHGVCDCESWTDIEQLHAGAYHIVGRKKDGSLVAAGLNRNGQCDVHKLNKT